MTAKVTEQDIRSAKLLKQSPWLMSVLHVPVLLAWLHVCFYLAVELAVPEMPWDRVECAHLVIHAVVLAFVGLVSIFTYGLQLHQWRTDSTDLEQG